MPELSFFLPPALVLFMIIRRGTRPQRIKPNRLWVFPGLIALLACLAIANGKMPSLIGFAVYAAAIVAGAVLGWFTTQHIELTLDDATGTVMSQPSRLATIGTAAFFLARFALDYATGSQGGGFWKTYLVAHGASLALITNAGLLFIAARGLSRAWHMLARINPMIEAHKASKTVIPGEPGP
jgi:hypothetical protein